MNLWTVLKQFPQYIYGWTVGLLIAILNDYAITAFALSGVFAGLIYGVFPGLLVFFLLYSAFRIVDNHAKAVHASTISVGSAISRLTPPPAPEPEVIDAEA